ncbi:MAG TPA: hypothetical protein VGH29_03460 [Candidatus Binataceae bacterium]|jgi:hypothetical protein
MALQITGLSKTYPNGVRALNNLSLGSGFRQHRTGWIERTDAKK